MDSSQPQITPFEPGTGGPEAEEGLGPPHNIEVEQALLGAILVNNAAAEKVSDFLLPGHFYDPLHGRIYEACLKLIERGQLATAITLKPFFESDEALRAVGGARYLAKLAGAAITIYNAESFGRQIHDLAIRRSLIDIGKEMVVEAIETEIDDDAMSQIERAEHRLFELAETGEVESGFKPFRRSVTAAVEMVEAAYKRDGKVTGVATGLRALDEKLGGLHRSDLVVLAGRPSMGKTALATNIGFNAAKARARALAAGGDPQDKDLDGAVVGFFSLEMSAEQLAMRMLAEEANIPSEKLRRGMMNKADFQNLVRAAQEIEEAPFFIDDTPALSIAALRARARRLKRQHGLSLVIVDYLQLLRPAGNRNLDSRVLEISEITRGLKALAKELNLPVLALSQLSRAVEQREDKRPLLADLRESGSIEQDADVVMFVFREEYYHERKEPERDTESHEKWLEKGEQILGKAEIIIGKQRHGPTGTVRLHFNKETTRFGDLDEDDHLPYATG